MNIFFFNETDRYKSFEIQLYLVNVYLHIYYLDALFLIFYINTKYLII